MKNQSDPYRLAILSRFQEVLRSEGFAAALKKAAIYPYRRVQRNRFLKAIAGKSAEDTFTFIYEKDWWKGGESPSGNGSTLEYTENLRAEIIKIVGKYSIRSILDAPYGDFNWMKALLPQLNIDYIGGDIVRPIIDRLNETYRTNSVSFIHLDITRMTLPDADMMICRDCLFHLSYDESRLFLENFSSSNIKYLLTTTHKNPSRFQTSDIRTGDFRLMDLFSPPYNLSSNPLYRIDDWLYPDVEREMVLWTRAQIAAAMNRFGHPT